MTTRQSSSSWNSPKEISIPSPSELQVIIRHGDADLAVKYGQSVGEGLAAQLTTSQIRNVFTTVRKIEMNWPVRQDTDQEKRATSAAVRQLKLLRPKLAYQASREQRGGSGMKTLAALLSSAIELVGEDRGRFQHFVDFFEAILAYHTAAQG